MRYDPLGYRATTDDIWTQFGTYGSSYGQSEYENLSFCDLLKDDSFTPLSEVTTELTSVTPSSITSSLTVSPPRYEKRTKYLLTIKKVVTTRGDRFQVLKICSLNNNHRSQFNIIFLSHQQPNHP